MVVFQFDELVGRFSSFVHEVDVAVRLAFSVEEARSGRHLINPTLAAISGYELFHRLFINDQPFSEDWVLLPSSVLP